MAHSWEHWAGVAGLTAPCGVGGIGVSIAAFQAADPCSIPGQRSELTFCRGPRRGVWVSETRTPVFCMTGGDTPHIYICIYKYTHTSLLSINVHNHKIPKYAVCKHEEEGQLAQVSKQKNLESNVREQEASGMGKWRRQGSQATLPFSRFSASFIWGGN